MRLYENTEQLQIVVNFNAHSNSTNKTNSWCDNIELFID